MKMVMAVVQADDARQVTDALVNAGHRVTRMATTGGWLRRENVTLLIGVEEEQLDDVLRLLNQTSQRRTALLSMPLEISGTVNAEVFNVEIGGATVFILDVERYEHY
jgi:uncharacterized protein YaaQ